MDGIDFQNFFLGLLLSTPRIVGITLFIPFLRPPQIPTMARNTIVFILGLVILPLIWQETSALKGQILFLLVLKEMLIGLIIGFIISLTFLIPQAVGDFIDNQRGASIAQIFNPAFGGQSSPMGLLLSQAFLVWFIAAGGFVLLFDFIFTSFSILPIGSFLPKNDLHLWSYAAHGFSAFLKLSLVIAAPVVLSMLISEIALGLVSRFAPQLNVFFISMSLKGIVAILILILYFSNILDHIWREGLFFDLATEFEKDASK